MGTANDRTVTTSNGLRKFRKRILYPVIVGVIVGVVLVLFGNLFQDKSAPAADPANSSSPVSSPTFTTGSTPTLETSTPPTIESPRILVQTQIGEPVGDGRKLGPNLYQLGDGGEADIAFSWLLGTANGGRTDDGCQITVSIDGPQEFLNVETAECSGAFATSFNGSANGIAVVTPGTYTISVKDEVTGATGSINFTVKS